MSGPAPTPTPPKETASAQTGTNIGTAVANQSMNNVNQVTPYGTQTYSQSGTTTYKDPYTGQTYEIPQYTMTQTLDPSQQAILDNQNAAKTSMSAQGASMASSMAGMTNPYSSSWVPDTTTTSNYLYDLGAQRLDPMFANQSAALQTQLANQGIMPGTEAYNTAMTLQGQQENDAYNQLLLTGNQQAYDQQMGIHNQQVADYNGQANMAMGLTNGTPIVNPNYAPTQSSNIPTTDVAAIQANSDAAAQAAYQQQQAMWGSTLGAVGGLFSMSDRRAKEDIKKVAETKDGMGLYSYRYKGSAKTQVGLMAQEVKKKKPEAVATGADGLMRVNYAEALK